MTVALSTLDKTFVKVVDIYLHITSLKTGSQVASGPQDLTPTDEDLRP